MARVAVIGAGMGGLAAAARLAHAGHKVSIFEAASTYGGKLGAVQLGEFTFDSGPSLLTLPQVYRDLFTETGGDLDEHVAIEPVDPLCHYRFPDGTGLDIPHAYDEIPAAMAAALGAQAGSQWAALMEQAHRLWSLIGEPVLHHPLDGMRDLLRHATHLRDLRAIAPWRTLRGAGKRLADPRLRMLLDRYATYTGSDPRRLPALMTVVPYIEQRHGGWYVRGGLRRLADALHAHCAELGVRFHFDTRVTAILTDTTGVRGLRLADDDHVAADIVVSDADAEHLHRDLLTDRRAARARRALARTQPSLSGFVLLLALRGVTTPRHHHRVLFPADYDAEFDALFGNRPHPVPDPTVYICSPEDPTVAPEGCEAWFVLVNAPRHGPVDWTAPGLADSYADRVLDVLAARGFDVRDRILHQTARTPADWEADTGSVGGSLYGSSSNGARAALLRPANRSRVPGLFLVGGSAHPGGGLPLVALSAAIVARLIGPA